jgi:phage tail sheath gpL-like
MVAVSQATVARITGTEFPFVDLSGDAARFLPQQIAVFGQGSTASTFATTPARVTTATEVGTTYGFGSPLHLAVLQLLPQNGDGVGIIPVTVYPMEDAGTGTSSAGTITPSGTPTVLASYVVRINNIDSAGFNIAVGDAVDVVIDSMVTAINAVIEMPVIASDGTTVLDLESKWAGVSANDIHVEVIGPDSTASGNSFAIVQPTGGTNNPTVDAGILSIGDKWESLVLNCLDSTDTTALDAFKDWGEGRWVPTVSKQAVVFTGDTQTAVASSIAVPDARPTDRINCQLVCPGSNDLPFVVAARQLARIAVIANDDPASDYPAEATGLTPPSDAADNWTHTERQIAVTSGCSTVEIKDGAVNISDVVTHYHPSGDALPPYRFVKDIIKTQQKSYGLKLIFESPDWNGAPLVPDAQKVTNPNAKKPKMAKAEIASLITGLAEAAVISDPETAISTIVANISTTNPNRLDVSYTDQNSGNTNIKSITNNWGFYFGTAAVVG